MKKIRNLLIALFLVVCAVALVGCKKDEPKEVTAVGYGLVHKDYVGIATVTVKEEVVTAVSFEEVYLPTHWAVLTSVEGVEEALYVTYTTSKGATVNVAKYIVVGDKTFTATAGEADAVYSAEGIADLKAWVQESEENAKWYAEALLANNAKAVDAAGTKVTFQIKADAEGGFKKSTTGYWPTSMGVGLGWQGNMDALASALVGTKMNVADGDIVQDETAKTWKFGDVTSTATLVDAKDYYAVAKKAYDKAVAE